MLRDKKLLRLEKILIALAALFLMGGCSDDTQTDSDTGGSSSGVVDTSSSSSGGDVADMTEDSADMAPLCMAGEIVCGDTNTLDICQDDGTFMSEACPDSQRCFEGECAEVICDAGKVEGCEGYQYIGCNPVGTGTGVFDCPPGFTCNDDAAGCIPQLCTPGSIKCKDEQGTVGGTDEFLLCNDAGTAYEDLGGKCSDIDAKRVCGSNPETGQDDCLTRCDTLIKSSYIGCDYWAVDLDNIAEGDFPTAADQVFAVVVSNASEDVNAIVDVYDSAGFYTDPQAPLITVELQPGELRVIPLPPDCYDGGNNCSQLRAVNDTVITPSAYRVQSDAPITAYQFNPLDNSTPVYSNDASILFPLPSLGFRYRVMAAGTKWFTSPSYLTVVGTTEGETTVSVTPRVRTMPGINRLNNEPIPAIQPGETFTTTLHPFEVLNISSGREDTFSETDTRYPRIAIPTGDLTGTEIIADQPIAVFAGSECTEIPNTDPRTGACDHMEQQLFPVNNWGLTYHAVKSWPRNDARDFWRIMARSDGTVVTTSPNQIGSSTRRLDAGEWFTFDSTQSFTISSNLPILVGQYLSGEFDPLNADLGRAAGIGDPAFIVGVPVERYRDNYVFLAPDAYANDYITIIAPEGATLILDGTELTEAELTSRAAITEIVGDSGYQSVRLEIEDGAHTLEADAKVGLYVYGFDSFVSYGYPAGLDLGGE